LTSIKIKQFQATQDYTNIEYLYYESSRHILVLLVVQTVSLLKK